MDALEGRAVPNVQLDWQAEGTSIASFIIKLSRVHSTGSCTFQDPVLFDPTRTIYLFSLKTAIPLSTVVLLLFKMLAICCFVTFGLFLISDRIRYCVSFNSEDLLPVLLPSLLPITLIHLNGIVRAYTLCFPACSQYLPNGITMAEINLQRTCQNN